MDTHYHKKMIMSSAKKMEFSTEWGYRTMVGNGQTEYAGVAFLMAVRARLLLWEGVAAWVSLPVEFRLTGQDEPAG